MCLSRGLGIWAKYRKVEWIQPWVGKQGREQDCLYGCWVDAAAFLIGAFGGVAKLLAWMPRPGLQSVHRKQRALWSDGRLAGCARLS